MISFVIPVYRSAESLPELRDSWAENNMVHLSSLITDSYDIYGTFPVNSMEDLQNRKLNAPGTSANWLRNTGATPVDGALTTYYTNIQTGVTEGTLSFASGILPTRVYEVAPELTRVGIGSMYFGGIAANKDFFDGLPADEQQLIVDASDHAYDITMEHIQGLADESLDKILAASDEVTVTRLTDEQIEAFKARAPQVEEAYLEMTGENGEVLLEQFKADLEAVQSN